MAENKREGIRAQLRDLIMGQLQERGHTEDAELLEYIDQAVFHMGQQVYLPLKERLWLRNSLYDSFRRLDILQELLDDKSVTEIMINGAGKIFIEQSGNVRLWERRFEKPEQLEDIIQQVVSRVNRVVNVSSPIVDARLEDGSRVHVVLPPVALDGPAVTIRKFPEPITMEKLVGLGALTEEAADCLKVLVEEKRNLFISGGTNSGKTTFLNALSAFIPPQERVITIEDSAELQITQVPEVRGKEALDMLQAMNTGHPGSLSTGHGNSPKDMVSRLETMVLMAADLPLEAIRGQIASALDVMVHLGRMKDGTRRVLSVMEIGGYRNGEVEMEPLYAFCPETGRLEKTGKLSGGKISGNAGDFEGRREKGSG